MTRKLVTIAALGTIAIAAYSPVGRNSSDVYKLYARGSGAVGKGVNAVGEAAMDVRTLSLTEVVPVLPREGNPTVMGVASWYGPGFAGRRTASGELYNQEQLTAASTIIPLGSRVMVTNLSSGRAVQVCINDHGPYVKGRNIDLSHRAARMLGIVSSGIGRVRIDVLSQPARYTASTLVNCARAISASKFVTRSAAIGASIRRRAVW